MNLQDFLSYLQSLDILIEVKDGRLICNAPKGVLTASLQAEISQRKKEIIDFLQHTPSSLDIEPIQVQTRPELLPLSFAQQRLWFLEQLNPGLATYNVPFSFRLTGDLKVEALQQSLSEIVRRHEVLRTTFRAVGDQSAQIIAPPTPIQLPVIDLTDLSSAKRESRVRQHLQDEAKKPFKLTEGPLLRASIVRLAKTDHIFCVVLHHIVSDGWSTGVFLRELSALYTSFSNGQPHSLPELSIQYADFSLWQRQSLSGPLLEQQLTYWKKHLANVPTILELPTARPRQAVQNFEGASYETHISPMLVKALRALSQREGATLFMTLLAAFQVLLYRYTGHSDFVIGSPIANRHHAEIEHLIGFFVNTLPLRAQLDDNISFTTLLRHVRETCLEAYAHQDIPFEKIVEELHLPRDLSRNALCQMSFVLQNTPGYSLSLPRVEVEELSISTDTSKFDLTLLVNTAIRDVTIAIEYSTDLFDAETIERMAGHYQHILEGILKDPGQNIATLPLLTDAERHQLLVEWNDTRVEYPQEQCIQDLFEAQVERTPDALAVVYENQTLTYRELNQRANQLGHHLQKLGVGPDVLVGVYVERSLEMIVGLLGILKAGGAYVPIDPNYPPERQKFIVKDARISIILTQEQLLKGKNSPWLETLGEEQTLFVCLDRDWTKIAQETDSNPRRIVSPDHLAYVIYTSGSTGLPKGAMIIHRGLTNYLNWCLHAYPVKQGIGAPVHSSLSFDLTVTSIFPALLAGQKIWLMPEKTSLESLEQLLKKETDFSLIKITPAHLRLLIDQMASVPVAGKARAFIIGGENLYAEHVNFWLENAPETALVNEYGPTETVVGCCVYTIPPHSKVKGVVPIGRPIDNTQLYVLDDHLQPVPIGIPGELYIGGVGLARGYFNQPDLTAQKFIPNPFGQQPGERLYKTGDLVRWLPDGNLECLGRLDFQVKIRGYRIELGEIETVLAEHPAVQESLVVAHAEATGQKRLIAYFTPTDELQLKKEEIISELRNHLKQKLPDYMLPGAFVPMEQFPLTPNGKIDRKALPEPDRAALVGSAEFIPPQTPTEQILADIWANLLGLQQVGKHDNFFELGGDSIISLQFISRAQAKGLYLTPRQVFEAQTIEALAKIAQPNNPVQAEQGLVLGQIPLTPIQHYFFEHHPVNPHHYNQSVLINPTQKLELDLLSQTVGCLLRHHDSLRLRFELTKQGWKQELVTIQSMSDSIVHIDLAGLSSDEQQDKIKIINTELQASLDIHAGPLLRVALFDLGVERHQELLIIIHHLAIDLVSWEILLSDFWAVYDQCAQNQVPQLPEKSSSFKSWAEWLVKYAHQEKLLAELSYWLAIGQQPISPLPVDRPAQRGRNRDAGRVEVTLSETETAALLRDVPGIYHTQINDILLTALAQAFAAWIGQSTLLINLEGHGREAENLDLSRTVGWFTSIFPVCLQLDAKENGAIIKSIKEQLRHIPQKGLGFGILRYLNQETAAQLTKLPQAEVCFNYGGQFKTMTTRSLGGEASDAEQLTYLFNINGAVDNNQLSISWIYDRNLYQLETVEKLAKSFIKALQNLIVHCQSPQAGGFTPSDFPLSALSQAELDRLIGRGLNIADIYPLSPLQSVILSQSVNAPDSGIYFTQTRFQITGDLNVSRFKQAWQKILDRHTILRTSFAWQGLPAPVQIVHNQAALTWDEQDWRNIPAAEQASRLEQLLQHERRNGFRLIQVPLTKCTLIHFDENRYQFVWHCHHLLMDGWSSRLLIQEVLDFYEDPANIVKPAQPYQDYIAWIAKQDLGKTEQFWREHLAGFTASTLLPDRKQAPYLRSGHYEEENLFLTPGLTTALQSLTQQYRLTLNTLCQGAWTLVLHQYSGQQDIVFGVTVSGRSAPLADIESRIGLFINTLPLRVKVLPELPLLAWLQSIMQEQVLLEQFSYTHPDLINACSQMPTTEPLFQSTLRFQNYPFKENGTQSTKSQLKIGAFPGIDWWHFPLNLVIVPDLRLQLSISYDNLSFEPAFICEILQKLEAVLSHFVDETSDSKLSSLLPG